MAMSDEDIDEVIKKLESKKSGRKKVHGEERLEKLKSKPNSELSVDEKMEIDRLSEHVSRQKRERDFAEAWKKLR